VAPRTATSERSTLSGTWRSYRVAVSALAAAIALIGDRIALFTTDNNASSLLFCS
jgi:hypothetical protein